jgi:transcription initiation factor TFIIIB Brf1 subunit/transcription initiation factor TFIIB
MDNEDDLIVCQNCGSTNLYRDDFNDDLICSECNTQSQAFSQRETAEDPEGFTTSVRRLRMAPNRKVANIVEDKVDEDYFVPTLMEFSEAFLELIESAAMRSVSENLLPRLDQVVEEGFENYREEIVKTAKEIWCLFLERFDEAANYFMIHYPGFRISLKDRFLTAGMRVFLWKQLNQSYRGSEQGDDGDGDDGDDGDYDMGNSDDHDSDNDSVVNYEEEEEEDDDDENHSTGTDNDDLRRRRRKRKRKNSNGRNHSKQNTIHRWKQRVAYNPVTNQNYSQGQSQKVDPFQDRDQSNKKSWKMLKALFSKYSFYPKDESLYWKLAIIEIFPDLNLATAIVYLAHLCLQTGVSSYLLVGWANSGLYPHLLDGYSQLSPKTRHLLRNVKRKWYRDVKKFPSPEVIDDLASVLLTCLVDPNDSLDDDSILADLYRMNVTRLKNIPFWTESVLIRKVYFRRLVKEKIRSIKSDSIKMVGSSSSQLDPLDQDSQEISDDPPTVSKTFYNVGLMMNLFCAFLGFEEHVLDFTYALMGFPVFCHESKANDDWLPAPLKLAQPHLIVTSLHALAVIVVACKFVPGWDKWVIQLTEKDQHDNATVKDHSMTHVGKHQSENSDSDESEVILAAKRTLKRQKTLSFVEDDDDDQSNTCQVESSHVKFTDIPYNNHDGENAFGYLDSMTKDVSANNSKYDFPSTFSWRKKRSAQYRQSGTSVKGSKVLGDCSLSKNIPCELNSSFGLSDYYVEKGFNICISGVYNPYAMLLGYIKNRLYVDVNTLHLLVTRLDDEILSCAAPLKNKNIAKLPNNQSFASNDDDDDGISESSAS